MEETLRDDASPEGHSALQQELRALETLSSIADTVHRSLDFKTVAERAVEAIRTYTPFACTAIFSLNRESSTLEPVASEGFPGEVVHHGMRLPLNGSFMGLGLTLRRVVTSEDLRRETRGLSSLRRTLVRDGFRRAITVPLIHNDERLGVMGLILRGERSLTSRERETLLALGKSVALAMANARHVERIRVESEQRREAEQALRESEERYARATAAAKVGVWDWDIERGRLYIDPRMKALLGYADSEIANDFEAWLRHVHPDDRRALRKAIDAHLQGQAPELASEHRVLHKDGSVHWILGRGTVLRNAQGKIVRLVGTDTDITDLKRLELERRKIEEQMIRAEKLKSLGVMAGGVAHEFNNLLTGVLGNAGLARMSLDEDSPALESIQRIETAAQRAAELSRQLLAYSGKGNFVLQPLDLSRLVHETNDLLHATASKKAQVRCELDEELPAVEGDPRRLQQVVINLVSNASAALGGRNGTITVSTGTLDVDAAAGEQERHGDPVSGRCVYLSVSDSGQGMDREEAATLFDPFFTNEFTGRGLGLAAVLGIVRGHRGAIEIHTAPGAGTRIRVLLPAAERPREAARETRPQQEYGDLGFGTVLVVDDELGVRTVARAVLQRAGMTVIEARDGCEALELFCERPAEIDLVLLDLTMPRMNGQETLEAIRAVRPDARVILSSGFSASEAVRDVDEGRLAGFLEKPYSPQALIDAVRHALDR